jgi:ribose-phosphate pyrophosphokinase
VPITGRLLANLIETAGADRLVTIDLHAGQIQGFFNIPVDELTAQYQIVRYFREKDLPNLVLVATDSGAAKRAWNVARQLETPMAIIDKRRVGNEERVEAVGMIGDVKDCPVLIVEDEINTGGTIVESVRTLRDKGASSVYVACTHPILSGNASQRLADAEIDELVVTDTVPIADGKRLPNMTVITLAPLLGEAIRRIHTGQSVGELFQ